jgi:hypothetical protein
MMPMNNNEPDDNDDVDDDYVHECETVTSARMLHMRITLMLMLQFRWSRSEKTTSCSI